MLRNNWYLILGLFLTTLTTMCTVGNQLSNDSKPLVTNENSIPPSINLPDRGPAPELLNEIWLNTDRPLRIADMRGKVVLLDFWTFG
jgi:hypothetical protein